MKAHLLAILPFLAAWSAATPLANPQPLNFLEARDNGILNLGLLNGLIFNGILGGQGTYGIETNSSGLYAIGPLPITLTYLYSLVQS